jgi:glucose-1-phosphate thymidylyltransferase
VANQPIVYHVIDGLRAAGAGDVAVAGEAGTLLDVRRCLKEKGPERGRPEYTLCGPGLGDALRSVATLVGDSACFLQPASGLLGGPLPPLLDLLHAGSSDLVLLVGLAAAEKLGLRGRGLADLTRLRRAGEGQKIAEVGVFGPGALKRASELVDPGETADLAVIAERLAATGSIVRFHVVESWCRYRGHGRELLELNRLALDRLVPDVRSSLRNENQIEGRVHIHPTASATASVIVGPTVIGAGAHIADAYIGPYTSVGEGVRIEGAEIERSIVSAGASVMHVGGRLVSSLVGRDAHVFRDFSLPRAIRLRVGAGDEGALC